MAEKLSFKGALLKLRKTPNDATAQARVTDEIQDRALPALDGEGQIDVAETDEGVTFANRPGRRLNSMEGRVSLSDWLSRQAPQDEACPISGRLLYKGVTTQGRPKVDWSQVPMSRRFAVAMARLNHEPAAQPQQEEIAAAAMKQEAPPVPFSRFLQEWAELAKAVEGGRPSAAQRNLHQTSKDACYHEEAPAAAGSSFPVETVTAQPEPGLAPQPGVRICAACGRAENDHDQRHQFVAQEEPPKAGAAPLVVILYSGADSNLAQALRGHLRGAERQEKIAVWDLSQIRPGAVRMDTIRERLGAARAVVWLVSPSLEDDLNVKQMTTMSSQARQIPVLVVRGIKAVLGVA